MTILLSLGKIKMSSSLNIEEIQTPDEQSETDVEVPLTKPVKEKKPRTQKQIEALAMGRAKIQANVQKRKHEKKIESAKLLLANDIIIPEPKPAPKKKAVVPKVTEEEDDESDTEEHIVYVKKKSAPKKNKKKIIVYQDTSESDDDEDEEEEEIKRGIHPPNGISERPKHFKSQQNKKSVVKVQHHQQQQQHQQPSKTKPREINYFCD